jgi:hypothetical protein
MELFREDRATPQASILGRHDVLGHSFKENSRHHPFVFMIDGMAVKDGHASDYGVGEVHKGSETGLTDFREFERTENRGRHNSTGRNDGSSADAERDIANFQAIAHSSFCHVESGS